MMQNEIEKEQESEYIVPYHYLSDEEKLISFPKTLITSPLYLNYLKSVLDELSPIDGQKILDAGCGDGRLCHEAKRRDRRFELYGLDYSTRAIGFAKLYNPEVHFVVADLSKTLPFDNESFDQIVLVETIEHITPEKLNQTFCEIFRVLKRKGRIIITVPHTNRKLSRKHFQHFDSHKLESLINTNFDIIKFQGFHKSGYLRNLIFRIIVISYYILYPLKTNFVRKLSNFGFSYFSRHLQNCGPDEGFCLMCIAIKS